MVLGLRTDLGCSARRRSPVTVSENHSALTAANCFHSPGRSSSEKIAVTGQTGTQASQSTHSSGWM